VGQFLLQALLFCRIDRSREAISQREEPLAFLRPCFGRSTTA